MIFPVPAKDVIYIDFTHLPKGEYQIELFNLAGKTLITSNYLFDMGTLFHLDVHGLSSGMYIIILKDAEAGILAARKFTKMK